ncbi:MAG: hypothetical protein WA005_04485 [Candidatus Binataceae bacterium]
MKEISDGAQQERKGVYLYRYRSMASGDVDDERLAATLTEAKIYFPSPRELNDPFECVVPSFKAAKGAALRQLVRKGIKEEMPRANRAERRHIERDTLIDHCINNRNSG